MNDQLLRITHVSIFDLFGLYDHEVPLNSSERITILHGPNGVGKTILLKCISAFFNGHYSFLRKTPFASFYVKLSDGTQVTITRELIARTQKRQVKNEQAIANLFAEIVRPNGDKKTMPIKRSADVNHLAKMVEQSSPYISQVDDNLWLDRRIDRVYTSEELLELSPELLGPGRIAHLHEAEPEELQKLRKMVKVSVVETDRLAAPTIEEWEYRGNRPRRAATSAVNSYARHLRDQIETTLAQYGRSAQQLDQTFPQRLIQQHIQEFDLADLKKRMELLEAHQQQLSEIGLLDKIPSRPFDPDSLDDAETTKLGPITLYLTDSESKISVFDPVAKRLHLLVDSARNKFKNKILSINKDRGIQVNGLNGDPLDLESLSSGEQHEIVLMYELLFKTPPNSLIMIDEPELSLHVSWQRLFLPELLSVAKTVGFDVILATHSPFIVGSRTDLMIGLDMNREDMPTIGDTSSKDAVS